MKKIIKIFLSILIALFLFLAGVGSGVYFMHTDSQFKDRLWLSMNVSLIPSKQKNYMEISNPENVSFTNLDYQETIQKKLNKQKKKENYESNNPLLVLNPFGTNTTGMYIYFKDRDAASIRYTISCEGYADYEATMANTSDKSGTFEGQIIGLMDDAVNTLKITTLDQNGKILKENSIKIKLPVLGTGKPKQLTVTEQNDTKQLSNGLFTMFGFDRNNTTKHPLILYDNNGVLRAEFPLKVKNGDVNIKFIDDCITYTYEDDLFFMVNSLGQIKKTYSIDGYSVHHDFEYDGDHTMYILVDKDGEDTVEDLLLSLDLKTGEYKEVIDMKTILPDIYKRAKLPDRDKQLDWIHFNTVDYIEGGDILLSSRELSTVFRMKDIHTNPTIVYMIADSEIWKDTPYENLLLTKDGDFLSQFGQHTTTYLADDSLSDGQYYIYMYDNNFAYSSSWRSFNWRMYDGPGFWDTDADASHFYKYLIDENTSTYKLVQSIDLPYSMVVSSAEVMDNNNIVTCSGVGGVVQELDSEGNVLVRFDLKLKSYVYRSLKFTFENFWF